MTSLSPKQKEIYTLMKLGFKQTTMAAMMGVKVKTIHQQARMMYQKLGLEGYDQDKQLVIMRRKNDEDCIIPATTSTCAS